MILCELCGRRVQEPEHRICIDCIIREEARSAQAYVHASTERLQELERRLARFQRGE